MGCKSCANIPVWKFTNKKQLCKNCFCDYFERKVFATIRKFNLMPKNRIFLIRKDNSVNLNVLSFVLKKKFQVKFSNKSNIDSNSLSQIAEDIFFNALNGNFNIKIKKLSPLHYLTDTEIDLYAGLKNIKGKERQENRKIKELFSKFRDKNPDLEHNIVNAFEQMR
jgi:hypothetical protein